MIHRFSNIRASLDFDRDDLRGLIAMVLQISADRVRTARIFRQSVDARDKGDVHFVLSLDVCLAPGFQLRALPRGVTASVVEEAISPMPRRIISDERPLVVGLGPAGLFAALTLAESGLKPLVIERGLDVDSRMHDVQAFWAGGPLCEESNVQFGEGGAGAFSDGKLTTGINDPLCRRVLEVLHAHGAPEEILYLAKPHIGTDRLPDVVASIRRRIQALGGEVCFQHRLERLVIENGAIAGVQIRRPDGSRMDFATGSVLLAVGHSARDTFEMLHALGVPMQPKPFSIGARIEHAQKLINRSQYGAAATHPALGAADYKLNVRLKDGRGAYTFCMCPGGSVVAAASESNGVVTNGMSSFARDGENANSALLVSVQPSDFEGDDPLAGVRFQRQWEYAAFRAGGSDFHAPAQLVGDFLARKPSESARSVQPTYRPGVCFGSLDECLPGFIANDMREALGLMDRRLHGFAHPDAVLTGPETRSSSPLRILRNEACMSAIGGLYPCGEGAGYAGGIMSAAVDGIRCAEAMLTRIEENA